MHESIIADITYWKVVQAACTWGRVESRGVRQMSQANRCNRPTSSHTFPRRRLDVTSSSGCQGNAAAAVPDAGSIQVPPCSTGASASSLVLKETDRWSPWRRTLAGQESATINNQTFTILEPSPRPWLHVKKFYNSRKNVETVVTFKIWKKKFFCFRRSLRLAANFASWIFANVPDFAKDFSKSCKTFSGNFWFISVADVVTCEIILREHELQEGSFSKGVRRMIKKVENFSISHTVLEAEHKNKAAVTDTTRLRVIQSHLCTHLLCIFVWYFFVLCVANIV